MSLDKIFANIGSLDLVSWAKTIPPEHRILLLIMGWTANEIAKRKVYESIFGDIGSDPDEKDNSFTQACRELGVDPQVLAAPLQALVKKYGKALGAKDRS